MATDGGIDWDRFADLALSRHRVGPTLANAVLELDPPDHIAARFQASLNQAALSALAEKAETLRLVTALRGSGCDPVLLKGWALAERLFGSASLRHSKDIDLHVRPDEVPGAVACLQELGYSALTGHQTRMKLAAAGAQAVLTETNDIAFVDASGQQVELHWRFSHLAGWPELVDIPRATTDQPIDRSGISVRVLSDRANLIYLSQHGQLHMWGRLKWLADIAELCRRCRPEDLLSDLEIADGIGAGRPVRIAIWLAHHCLDSPVPAGWPEPTWLERRALVHFCRLIAAPGGEPGQPWARMQYHLSVLAFGQGWRQKLASPRYAFWRNLRLYLAGHQLA
ncbi:MAG: nucleotidyltransferase family protein [Pseudomonadota bacterium]